MFLLSNLTYFVHLFYLGKLSNQSENIPKVLGGYFFETPCILFQIFT